MDKARFGQICECILFASGEPVSRDSIRMAFSDEIGVEFDELFKSFVIEYYRSSPVFQLIEVASGYQLTTKPEFSVYVRRIKTIQCKARLSRAACETLAIIAYRQPVTIPEIEHIRGVDIGGTIKNLLEKEFITILGRKHSPGNPLLYGTTSRFLIQFGLKDLKSLPDIREFETIFGSTTQVPALPFLSSEDTEVSVNKSQQMHGNHTIEHLSEMESK